MDIAYTPNVLSNVHRRRTIKKGFLMNYYRYITYALMVYKVSIFFLVVTQGKQCQKVFFVYYYTNIRVCYERLLYETFMPMLKIN